MKKYGAINQTENNRGEGVALIEGYSNVEHF
jgi:hypothetical protein